MSVFWQTEDNRKLYPTPESRADYVEFLLGDNMPFLWEDPQVHITSFKSSYDVSLIIHFALSLEPYRTISVSVRPRFIGQPSFVHEGCT